MLYSWQALPHRHRTKAPQPISLSVLDTFGLHRRSYFRLYISHARIVVFWAANFKEMSVYLPCHQHNHPSDLCHSRGHSSFLGRAPSLWWVGGYHIRCQIACATRAIGGDKECIVFVCAWCLQCDLQCEWSVQFNDGAQEPHYLRQFN